MIHDQFVADGALTPEQGRAQTVVTAVEPTPPPAPSPALAAFEKPSALEAFGSIQPVPAPRTYAFKALPTWDQAIQCRVF
ncbi:hypothetical protein [Aureimonas sp. AU4]|uniref:hypothetical protein n=1 Tax=Aureimonas sp. AU4 TaxID=1638163 RepID=UPI000A586CDD|nr:hypothetical protein [Aureimonas sp. AU4]